MNNPKPLLSAAPHFERYVTRHRLSWFATLQGLVFLSFVLLDKARNPALTYLLVATGAAICLPAIASLDVPARSNSPMPFLLALCWVAVGAAYFVIRVT